MSWSVFKWFSCRRPSACDIHCPVSVLIAQAILPHNFQVSLRKWQDFQKLPSYTFFSLLFAWCRTIALSLRRCDWLFPLSKCEASSGNCSDYKSTRERADSKGLYGRYRLRAIGSWSYALSLSWIHLEAFCWRRAVLIKISFFVLTSFDQFGRCLLLIDDWRQ